MATLSVATSRQWKNQAGEKQEKTEWHRVVLWNNKGSTLADIAERYCKKGDKVYVEGSIEYRSWQDREGQTRYTTEITARELILLSGGVTVRSRPSPRPARSARRPPAAPKGKESRSRTSPRRSTPRTTICRSEPVNRGSSLRRSGRRGRPAAPALPHGSRITPDPPPIARAGRVPPRPRPVSQP